MPEPTPDPIRQALPKRSATELIHSLRERAGYLTGESWERTANKEIMREAADMIEALAAAPAASPASPSDAGLIARLEQLPRYHVVGRYGGNLTVGVDPNGGWIRADDLVALLRERGEPTEFHILSINQGADGWVARYRDREVVASEPLEAFRELARQELNADPEFQRAVAELTGTVEPKEPTV